MKKKALMVAVMAVVMAAAAGFSSLVDAGPATDCAFYQYNCGISGVSISGIYGNNPGQDIGLAELITLPARVDVELKRLKAEAEYWKALKRIYKNSWR